MAVCDSGLEVSASFEVVGAYLGDSPQIDLKGFHFNRGCEGAVQTEFICIISQNRRVHRPDGFGFLESHHDLPFGQGDGAAL